MRHLVSTLLVASIALTLPVGAPREAAACGGYVTEDARVRSRVRALYARLAARDLAGAVAYFAPNAHVSPANYRGCCQPPMTPVAEYFGGRLGDRLVPDWSTLRVQVQGDGAWVTLSVRDGTALAVHHLSAHRGPDGWRLGSMQAGSHGDDVAMR